MKWKRKKRTTSPHAMHHLKVKMNEAVDQKTETGNCLVNCEQASTCIPAKIMKYLSLFDAEEHNGYGNSNSGKMTSPLMILVLIHVRCLATFALVSRCGNDR
jgi:hypothetical protein